MWHRETNIGRIYSKRDTLMSPGRRLWSGQPVLGRAQSCRLSLLLTTLATGNKYNVYSMQWNKILLYIQLYSPIYNNFPPFPKGSSKRQIDRFSCERGFLSKKVYYKVSLCENCQRQSCEAISLVCLTVQNLNFLPNWPNPSKTPISNRYSLAAPHS